MSILSITFCCHLEVLYSLTLNRTTLNRFNLVEKIHVADTRTFMYLRIYEINVYKNLFYFTQHHRVLSF